MNGLFVTATDTGAGKTFLSCLLIPLLEKARGGLRVRKPVESGCPLENGRLVPRDAVLLASAAHCKPPLEQVCTWRLRHTCSPARAAQLEGIELTIAKLAAACASSGDDNSFLLVEGAGGLCSPIARDGLNADLARRLELPLLIVVEDRLGCINHALLTMEAACSKNLKVAALVLNQTTRTNDDDTDNFAELRQLTDAPLFRLDYIDGTTQRPASGEGAAALVRYLLGDRPGGSSINEFP